MSKPEKNIREKMKSLREAYVRQLPDKIRELESLYDGLVLNPTGFSGLKEFILMAHSIKGSSASFGYREISDAALLLERLLKTLNESGERPDDNRLEDLKVRIGFLKDAVGLPADNGAAMDVSSGTVLSGERRETSGKRIVYLAEDDPYVRQSLSLQVRHFGYEVRTFGRLEDMLNASAERPPSALIADIVFPEGGLAGVEAVIKLQKGLSARLPVIFISARNDLSARLMAVRAGGDAYFVKPVNITELIDKLDALTKEKEEVQYRVLIVDDEPELAAYHSLILQQAGMLTEVVNKPMRVFDPLIEFNPDLILMDMYMPDCDGVDLARTIRQMGAYFSIPIVFLSAETNVDKQFRAMSMGGDDFLTKPIKPEHLISSVSVRAERMRIIRSFMQSDSLTGLLNHTKTKEFLDTELSKAARRDGKLAFAMIDIDLFKSVNDTYGHPTGDQVILSLSRLLRQRLRKTDIIGRYGGEEFAVILLDTDAGGALDIMDGIRNSFERIRHLADGGEFSSTFSCGIGCFPAYKDPVALSNAADKALYAAKRSGRNKVVLAEGPEAS